MLNEAEMTEEALKTTSKTETNLPTEAEEEEISSVGSLLQEIVEAQGDLESKDSVKALKQHLSQSLYPMMGKIVNFLGDVGVAVKDLADDLGDPSEFMGGENVEFFNDYFAIINGFILKWAPEASYRAENGDNLLLADLQALDQATRGAVKIMETYMSEESDEDEDDNG